MNGQKYIITEEQLKRLELVNMFIVREIRENTCKQIISDSVDVAVHMSNIAETLIRENTKEWYLPVPGGKFVWVPDKG